VKKGVVTMRQQDDVAKERWAGYGACISALGLGITHIVANLMGYMEASPAEKNLVLFLVWGTLPSLIFFVCSWAVLALVQSWGGKKWSRLQLIITWIAFVLMSLQFIWLSILSLRKGDFIFLYHIGPGPWSVLGSFMFGFTLWQVHRKLKKNDENKKIQFTP
jgi:hypothetical protein